MFSENSMSQYSFIASKLDNQIVDAENCNDPYIYISGINCMSVISLYIPPLTLSKSYQICCHLIAAIQRSNGALDHRDVAIHNDVTATTSTSNEMAKTCFNTKKRETSSVGIK